MKTLVIIGASGHGRVVADIAKNCGYEEIFFLDDKEGLTECGGYPVKGPTSEAARYGEETVVAIGNAAIRKRIQEDLKAQGISLATLIHPAAVIGEHVEIGDGTVVMAGAVINPGAKIGEGCIINTCASVDHDCRLADYVHISVGAHLAGTVQVGEQTWVGAGATVSNNIDICGNCMIGAGAVVVKSITAAGVYVGVPAKLMREGV